MSQDRPQDRPGEPEPTRLAGGRPPQDPPAAQPPQQPQEPWTPAGAPPAGQSPQGGGYGQPPQGGGGFGQPPQGGGYGQSPQGGGYGQPPQGGGYGPGGPGYGGPGGWGPPPGGFGPGGPEGPGGPRKPQDKKPLLIAGAALLVLLVVGGLGLFFVLGGEDDGADTATDETSQEATEEATEEEPTDEASEDTSEESEPETDNPTFTSEDLFSSGPICDDRAMANASEYDPEDPRIAAFIAFPESADYGNLIGPGIGESWGVDSDRHEDIQVAMCLTATDQVESQTCEAQDLDENLVDYEFVSATYTVEFVEAATGAVLAEGSELESTTQCPDSEYVFVSEEGDTRFSQPSAEDLDLEANTFITEGADES